MFLDPNVGFTSEALGSLAARDWLHLSIPWWNPYTGIGMPLAGEMQPGAFFLPFSLLLALPDGVLWLTLLMQAIAGLTMYALLRELRCTSRAALMGGLLFELNSTIAWAPGPIAVFCSLPFLPLLIWGIERAAKPSGGPAARLGVAAGVAYMLLAGFPEPAYLNGLLALLWWLVRVISGPARWRLLERVVTGGLIGLCLAAPLLVAFADDLAGSDAVAGHIAGWRFLPWRGLGMVLLPYAFGPLDFNNSGPFFGNLWGAVGGYCGLLLPVLALAGFYGRSTIALKILLAGWVVAALAKSFGFGPVMAAVNGLPAMRDVAFYRYFWPSAGFALAVLAAFGLDALAGPAPRPWPVFVGAALLVGAGLITYPEQSFWHWPYHMWPVYGLWGLSVGLAAAGLGVAAFFWLRWRGGKRASALACLVLFEAFALFSMPILTGGRHGAVELGAVRFLQAQPGMTRSYTLGPVQPNYGAYFQTAMIDHNVLPVPRNWASYVDAHILPGVVAKSGGIIFWPAWSPYASADRSVQGILPALETLGVNFVVSAPRTSLDGLSRVYADPAIDVWAVPGAAPYFEVTSGGPCAVGAISRESVTLSCKSPAMLERRELFMAGWHVWVDRAPGIVARDGDVFQAVAVPAGLHEVRFSFLPPYESAGLVIFICGIAGVFWMLWRVGRECVFEVRRWNHLGQS